MWLDQYARQGAEEAFGVPVREYVDLVYSAALRAVRSPPNSPKRCLLNLKGPGLSGGDRVVQPNLPGDVDLPGVGFRTSSGQRAPTHP